MRRRPILLCLVVAGLVGGCGTATSSQPAASTSPIASPPPSTTPSSSTAPSASAAVIAPSSPPIDAPGVLAVTCSPSGTEVAIRRVAVQEDGLHVHIRNTIGPDAAFTIDGVGGENAPDPEGNQLWILPPGVARIWCGVADPVSADDWIEVDLVDPFGYYVAAHAECASMTSSTIDYAPDAMGRRGDPVAIARSQIHGLRVSDRVERAGYVGAPGATVRVVRDDDVVALGTYAADNAGGWRLEGTTLCSDSGLTWGA